MHAYFTIKKRSGLFPPGGFSLQNRFRPFSVYKSNIISKVQIPHYFVWLSLCSCLFLDGLVA